MCYMFVCQMAVVDVDVDDSCFAALVVIMQTTLQEQLRVHAQTTISSGKIQVQNAAGLQSLVCDVMERNAHPVDLTVQIRRG